MSDDDNPRVRAAVEAATKALADPWLDSRVRRTIGRAIAAAFHAYDEALRLDTTRQIHRAIQRPRYK